MVKIISDSTSDLTKELIDKLDISVIPLHILLGNDEYRDGIDITPDKIYEWADEIAIVCSGDQPAYPCGICRQVMSEFFNPDTRIIIEECSGLKTYTMSEILPDSFSL